MKERLATIRTVLKKPLVRYLVIFAALGGALYFLRDAPVDVTLSVDLEKSHRLGDGVLRHLEVKVLDDEGTWISTSTFDFPAALYPDGPGPLRTKPSAIQLQVPPGQYKISLTMRYRRTGGGVAPPELLADFDVAVEDRETHLVVRP